MINDLFQSVTWYTGSSTSSSKMVCRSDRTEGGGGIGGRRVEIEGNRREDDSEKKQPIFGHSCKNSAKAVLTSGSENRNRSVASTGQKGWFCLYWKSSVKEITPQICTWESTDREKEVERAAKRLVCTVRFCLCIVTGPTTPIKCTTKVMLILL